MRTVAINISHRNLAVYAGDVIMKWCCRCQWCNWRPEPVDTFAEIIRLARSHVPKCEKTEISGWSPANGNAHEGWLIGLK